MRVVLLESIKGLGLKGVVKEVSDGYFHNFLAPRKLAAPATASQVKQVQVQKEKANEKLENMKESAVSIKGKIDNVMLTITARVSETGKLYAALREKDLVEIIKTQLKVEITEKNIVMDPIKELGDFPVKIKLYQGVIASLTAHVTTE